MRGQEGTLTPRPLGRGEVLAVGLQDGRVPRERMCSQAPHQGGARSCSCSVSAVSGETEDRVGVGLQMEGVSRSGR